MAYPTFRQHLDIKFWIAQYMTYEGWNFNSGNYLFTTDTK